MNHFTVVLGVFLAGLIGILLGSSYEWRMATRAVLRTLSIVDKETARVIVEMFGEDEVPKFRAKLNKRLEIACREITIGIIRKDP